MNYQARMQSPVSRYFKAALVSPVQAESVIAECGLENNQFRNPQTEIHNSFK